MTDLSGRVLPTFWWRPFTGGLRQAALDAHHFRPRMRRPLQEAGPAGWRLHNFGDELMPDLIQAAVGSISAQHVDAPHARFAGLGTILERLLRQSAPGLVVAGAGLGRPSGSVREELRNANLDIRAVRGRLTARALGVDLPMGDPGLLAPLIQAPTQMEVPPSGPRITLILHYRIARSPRHQRSLIRLLTGFSAHVIATSAPPLAILAAVRQSELVISTALHGVIVADALGVPAVPATELQDRTRDFRFDDYHSGLAVDAPELVPLPGADLSSLSRIAAARTAAIGAAPKERADELAPVFRQAVVDACSG